MRLRYVTYLCLLSLTLTATGQAQDNNTKKLGVLGGLAGAASGAAIGDSRGDALPGAIIGGAIGLITGAGVGSAIDDKQARERAYQAHVAQRRAEATTMADVINMTQAGLSDAVIVNHIQTRGVARRLGTGDLITLKEYGVSDNVIRAMQSPPPAPRVIYEPAPAPFIVREHYHVRPRPTWHYYHRHHHHRYRPRSGFHWGVHLN